MISLPAPFPQTLSFMNVKRPHRLSKMSTNETYKKNGNNSVLGKRKNPEENEGEEIEYCYNLPISPPQPPSIENFNCLQNGEKAKSFDNDGFWPFVINENNMSFSAESILGQRQMVFYPGNDISCKGNVYLIDYSQSPCKCIFLGEMWVYRDKDVQYFTLELKHINFIEKGNRGIYDKVTKRHFNKNLLSTKYHNQKMEKLFHEQQSVLYAMQEMLRYIVALDVDI